MNEREMKLYSTMVATLKYDSENYKNTEKLSTILEYSEIELLDTRIFSNKSYHFWEDVSVRVKIPLIKETRLLLKSFESLINDCYSGDEQYELRNILIRPKQIANLNDLDNLEIKSHTASFNNIREEVIQSIRMAKHSIWINIAWFTDDNLFQELCDQKLNGVNIRVLISDEESNQRMISKLKEQFETIIVQKWGFNNYNRLHSKYCIIDYSIVLHGSFNWTPTASQNEEHLTISIDRQLAKQYTDNFKEIFKNSYRRNL